MNKQIAYAKLVAGDIFLYEVIGKKTFKFVKLSSDNSTIIEGICRGIEISIPDDKVVTLVESIDEYLLSSNIKENLK